MSNIVDFPDDSLIEIEASEWIVKFESDEPPTPEDIKALHLWLAQSPKHKAVLMQMAEHWQQMDLLSELGMPEAAAGSTDKQANDWRFWLFAPVLAVLKGVMDLLTVPIKRPVVFASVLTLIGVAWFTKQQFYLAPMTSPIVMSFETQLGQQATHQLPDGSTLYLNTNSKASVSYTAQRRLITLHKGEGHFDVSHEPARPFDVRVGQQFVRAVGTAFSVRLAKDKLKVVVSEGVVDLRTINLGVTSIQANNLAGKSAEQGNEELAKAEHNAELSKVLGRLSAGQSIEVSTKLVSESKVVQQTNIQKQVINHRQGELERKLAWLDGHLSFAGEPLVEVLAEVSRYTDTRIDVIDEDLKQMRIGGQFKTGETEALFDVLEHGFQLDINRKSPTHVEISKNK